MIVIKMAITPSLNASRRLVFIGGPSILRERETIAGVRLLRTVPRRITRPLSFAVLVAWLVTMGVLVGRAYVQARSLNLATDLARYGPSAQWRGVYYRGEKIGFTVSQTSPNGDGFQMQEDARIQMALLGATSAAAIRTTAQLDRDFAVRSFEFSLDPGTGPVRVSGTVAGRHVSLTLDTPSGTQREERDLDEAPVLTVNLPRLLAARGLHAGTEQQVVVFDPATLRSERVTIAVGRREIVNVSAAMAGSGAAAGTYREVRRPMPAFRVELSIAGLTTSSWITDTGDVVREESQLGLMSVQESPETARRLAISRGVSADLLESSAVVPRNTTRVRIDDGRDVRRLRLRVEGVDLANPDVRGAGQTVEGDTLEIRDARTLRPSALDPDRGAYLVPEPLIESDDPAIRTEARTAVRGVTDPRIIAERLTRRVNAMLEKKPTVSLPSAREVLRTKIGDCNEHTALYVALARALGVPARIAVGLVYTRGAFFYHAWPEVYLEDGRGGGLWLPVDPTFNQFPADATHVRLARGGLDRQAAILPLIGRIKMTILEVDLAPDSAPVVIGRAATPAAPFASPVPVRTGLTCWSSPLGGPASR
jgi:transglutaminase-like putative cysteine protease